MSNKALTAVIECSRSKGASRLALLILADKTFSSLDFYEHKEGLRRLAKFCNCTERPLQRCLNGTPKRPGLVQLGELVIEPHAGPRGTDRYHIPILDGESGYDPQPCHDETHICNGKHTPLDRHREDIADADRDRRRAEREAQGGGNIATRRGGKNATTYARPNKVVAKTPPPPGENATTPPAILPPPPGDIATTISHIPISLPRESQASASSSKKMERAEPEPERLTWGEMEAWCNRQHVPPHAPDRVRAWNAAHPDRPWGVAENRIVEGSLA